MRSTLGAGSSDEPQEPRPTGRPATQGRGTSEPVASLCSMIDPQRAQEIEERLAGLLGVRVDDLRDYVEGNIRAGGKRRTGYRFVRGLHSGTYVRDPEGTDILPAGHQVPA